MDYSNILELIFDQQEQADIDQRRYRAEYGDEPEPLEFPCQWTHEQRAAMDVALEKAIAYLRNGGR